MKIISGGLKSQQQVPQQTLPQQPAQQQSHPGPIPGILGALAEGFGGGGDLLKGISSLVGRDVNIPTSFFNNMIPGLGLLNQFSAVTQEANKHLPSGLNIPNIAPPSSISLPTQQQIRENVVNPIAQATVGTEALKPRTATERGLQRGARAVPGIVGQLIMGGAPQGVAEGLKFGGRILSGVTAGQLAEEAGLPEWAQIGATIGGERGFDKLSKILSKSKMAPEGLAKIANDAKNKLYGEQADLGKNIYVAPASYGKTIEESIAELKSTAHDVRFTPENRAKALSTLESFNHDIADNAMMSADRLIERRGQLNALIKDTSNKPLRELYEKVRNRLIDRVDSLRPANKEWSKALTAADNVYSAIHWPDKFNEFVQKIPGIGRVLTNPIAHALASGGTSLFFSRNPVLSLGGALAGVGASKATGKALQLAPFIFGGKAPLKIALKAGVELMKGNYPAAIRGYTQVNRTVNRIEKQQRNEQKKPLKILSGGLKAQ